MLRIITTFLFLPSVAFPVITNTVCADGSHGSTNYDYTSLQAWEDDGDNNRNPGNNPDFWAECYASTNNLEIGRVEIAGWAEIPEPTKYPRIYVAPGHEHKGIVESVPSGPYIDDIINGNCIWVRENYVRIEGLYLKCDNTSLSTTREIVGNPGQDGTLPVEQLQHSVLVKDILIERTKNCKTKYGFQIYVAGTGGQTFSHGETNVLHLVNCVTYNLSASNGFTHVKSHVYSGSGLTNLVCMRIENCSFVNVPNAGASTLGYSRVMFSNSSFGVTSFSNVFINTAFVRNDFAFYCITNLPTYRYNQRFLPYSEYNAFHPQALIGPSYYLGAGNQTNIPSADALEMITTYSNATPYAGGYLHDEGGANDYTNDIIGILRPQGPEWDVGAFETTNAYPLVTGRRRIVMSKQ